MSVYKWRLKDAKLNSRGLLSPWKTRHTPTENRLEEGNRQRIQRLKVDGHAELVSASVRGDALLLARSEMLKQVIRLRSSKTSFICIKYGQHDKLPDRHGMVTSVTRTFITFCEEKLK